MKINIGTILQIGNALQTKAGKELKEFIEYVSAFADLAIRSLRNGLTFGDNFDCLVDIVELPHDEDQIIFVTKRPSGMIPVGGQSTTKMLDSFGWFVNDDNQVVVRATFTNSVAGDKAKITLVILY